MAGLSRSMVDVGISMVLRDEFSNQAGRISGSFASLMNDLNNWNRALTQQTAAAFDYGKEIVGGMFDAYQHSAGIYGQVFMTSKIAGATAQEQLELMQKTQEINARNPLTNADIASGERYLAMAGNTVDAIKNMIEPSAQLAAIFQMPLGGKGGTADLMTNIMATFGEASENATDVSNILYRATTSANISLTDLAQSFQYAGSTFRNANISLAEGAAMIGVLGNQGIQASSAGTALANMVRYLTLSITGQKVKGKAVLDAMGLTHDDLVDAYGNVRNITEIIPTLGEKMRGLSGTAKEIAMYNIFGVRGARAANALMNDYLYGGYKMAEILQKEQDENKSLEGTFKEWMQTPEGIIKQWEAAIDNLKTSVGTAFTPVFNTVLGLLTTVSNWVKAISDNGFGKWVLSIGAAVTIGGVLVNGIKLFYGTVRMVTTMTAYLKGQMSGAGGAMGVMNTQAGMLEQHLRTMVALMAEYVSLTTMGNITLPGGAVLSRASGTGAVITTKRGKTIPFSTYLERGYSTRARNGKPFTPNVGTRGDALNYWYTKTKSGRTSFGDIAQKAGPWYKPSSWMWTGRGFGRKYMFGGKANMAKWRNQPNGQAGPGIGSSLLSLGSGALMMMGGPLGLAIGAGLMAFSALKSSTDAQKQAAEEQAAATRENTAALEKSTAAQYMQFYAAHFEQAMVNAIRTGMKDSANKEPLRVRVTLNDGAEQEWVDGGSYSVDVDPYNVTE